MRENIVLEKSFAFAVLVVGVYRRLQTDTREFILSKQPVRSGTSIGANIEEAVGAISKREFIAKMQIAYKEARETRYWLRLLVATKFLSHAQAQELISGVEELRRLLRAILTSAKGDSETNR